MASAHRHKDDREIDLEATSASDGSDDEDSMDVNSDRLVHLNSSGGLSSTLIFEFGRAGRDSWTRRGRQSKLRPKRRRSKSQSGPRSLEPQSQSSQSRGELHQTMHFSSDSH
jgi:hypothetical protein